MNWRRGLLLAGIHLVVGGALLVWQESVYWPHIRMDVHHPQPTEVEQTTPDGALEVSFNPCEGGFWDGSRLPQTRIVETANLPVWIISGGHTPCSSDTWLESGIEMRLGRTRRSEATILTILCVGVALQWFFVGGFPLSQPKRWWWEPAAFITVCSTAAFVLVLIPGIRELSQLPALLAGLGWVYWFGLLLWKSLRSGWRLVRRTRVQEP